MPHRYQLIERIAFSLVVLSAVACSAFIAYEQVPGVKAAMHTGEDILRQSGEYSFACASSVSDVCGQLPVE